MISSLAYERPKTVLVVDDDPVFRSLAADTLSGAGLSVIEAADGIDALRRCGEVDPSLLLIDAVMPNLDGFALCRILRNRGATRHLPIVMVTGLRDHQALEQAYEAGATDFIVKPIEWGSLAQRMRYVLRNAGTSADLRESLPNPQSAEPQPAAEPGDDAGERPISILVVDDDPTIRLLTRDVLEGEGYQVLEAADGLAAYDICLHAAPGLIVSDVMMPRMDGFELCRLLRRRQETALLPILACPPVSMAMNPSPSPMTREPPISSSSQSARKS